MLNSLRRWLWKYWFWCPQWCLYSGGHPTGWACDRFRAGECIAGDLWRWKTHACRLAGPPEGEDHD
jgi:hypothetical protein